MILKNLWRRGTRSLLTLLGIATGVAAVVALGSIGNGIANNYGGALGLNNELIVSQAGALDVLMGGLDEKLAERIATIPDVTNVDPGVFTFINVEGSPFFLIYGYPPNSAATQHYRIVEGKPAVSANQVVLGRAAATDMKATLDDTVRLAGTPYRVVGIYETGQGLEESGGLVTLSAAQEIASKVGSVSLFQVGVRRGADIDTVISRIENLDEELAVSKSSEYKSGAQFTGYLSAMAYGVAAIAILIGGLGMMSAMVMSVLERTREIGTLRAVGWSRRRVVRMILGEAVVLSLLGGVLGVFFGIGLATAAGSVPGVGSMLKGGISPAIIVQGMVTALVLGLVGGYYPARTAARLEPVEALRYEGGAAGAPTGRWARLGGQAYRNLWRRRSRTLISATAIGIGVATLVMMGGLVDGVMVTMNGMSGSLDQGNITIMQGGAASMKLSKLDERIVAQVAAMPEVKSVSPSLLGFLTDKEMIFFIVIGVEPGSRAAEHYQITNGRAIQRPNEIMLGRALAESLKKNVGETLQLSDNRYKVVGIYETGVGFEDGAGTLALSEAQRLLGMPRAVSFIYVDVKDPTQGAAVAAAINARFPEARASLSSIFAQTGNDMATMGTLFTVIRLMSIFVGGIVVANTMIMSIFERTREIGTLRAIGWTPRRIIRQVVEESLLLTLLAALLGSVLGVLFMYGLASIPVYRGILVPKWTLATFATAIGVAVVLGILGGILPALRASRLQPVEALRYE